MLKVFFKDSSSGEGTLILQLIYFKEEKEREVDKQSFLLLVHSQYVCSSRSWTRLNLEPALPHKGGQHPVTGAIICRPPRICNNWELGSEPYV